MASQGGELSMDCKPHHSYSKLLKSFAEQNQSDQRYKLEEFVSRLEEERVKIDAFKRELPLCMQLLTNAMEASRQQLHAFISSNQDYTRPILEEFIPINHSNSQLESTDGKASSDKASWMTSAQLWSVGGTKLPQSTLTTSSSPNKENTENICFSVSPKLALDNKHRNGIGGGAFLPFSKERNSRRALPELALVASSEKEIIEEEKKRGEPETRGSCSTMNENNNSSKGSGDCGVVVDQGKGAAVASSETQTNTTTTSTSQNHRKARRCWSPDLHRRFVNALQMLGGSQVATPKQIRELMKVDGLTNDEVKSHLQKYRLHTRRPSPSIQTGAPAPQLVVLGGIWVPPEYATAHTGATALYGTHAPPPHYCAATTTVPQEFYTTAVPLQSPLPPPPHHHLSESIEDGKSESSSWKGESGENEGGERKGLAALRERGEESTGSEITLKF